jgi:hypothetical protein
MVTGQTRLKPFAWQPNASLDFIANARRHFAPSTLNCRHNFGVECSVSRVAARGASLSRYCYNFKKA